MDASRRTLCTQLCLFIRDCHCGILALWRAAVADLGEIGECEMNQATLQIFRRKLEETASRVRSDASSMIEQARGGSGGQAGGGLSNTPFHLGDMGSEEYSYDLNTTLLENEQYIVSEAHEALRRIEKGSYGTCERCGQAIARRRLDVLPYTRYCVRCAAAGETTPQVNLNAGRPRTPADTLAPEGEMNEDRPRWVDPLEFPSPPIHWGDVHAAGTAGGGTAIGGLAGGNQGHGEPTVAELEEATASGRFDVEDDRLDDRTPLSGRSGGAVGGTPARKRSV
jgi:RNA polymerase-binding transcription factor DksA